MDLHNNIGRQTASQLTPRNGDHLESYVNRFNSLIEQGEQLCSRLMVYNDNLTGPTPQPAQENKNLPRSASLMGQMREAEDRLSLLLSSLDSQLSRLGGMIG